MEASPDLSAQLRDVAMRARKRVTEGYLTNLNAQTQNASSPRVFTKAQSTGTVFHQSRDSKLKRRWSQSELDQDDKDNSDLEMSAEGNEAPGPLILDPKEGRPVKPLRNRALMPTQSLPANSLSNEETGLPSSAHIEEDWSSSSFKPTKLQF
ncbi:hypothetical protein D9758_001071 [Tetrapyrgos nigripes]|uniref:Uncharacterized protein n=1 Tax=Tetrapyrgos nigripes TaxID=182062 RepID=A0A8H5LTX0_9AGAR|nr:hypothetical protein D9758_001071 [Tetrapyrgos nigripes]